MSSAISKLAWTLTDVIVLGEFLEQIEQPDRIALANLHRALWLDRKLGRLDLTPAA